MEWWGWKNPVTMEMGKMKMGAIVTAKLRKGGSASKKTVLLFAPSSA
jgi:hypothetical protein